MPINSAQEEFDELLRDKDVENRHPEDRLARSDDERSDDEDSAANDYHERDLDSDYADEDIEDTVNSKMRSNYYLPSIRSEANTGPKGVIADAHAFEQAKKKARRFTLFGNKEASPPTSYQVNAWHDEKHHSSEEESEEGFMKKWREARLRELQNAGQRMRSRTRSPSKKIYGNLARVDGEGFLDAIEKVHRDTVVVVYIYDDTSDTSSLIEDCVRNVARKHNTTRFIKMHYEEAEMEVAGVPAIIAYRGGEKFAGLVPLMDELPDDAELSPISLEVTLRRNQILF